MTFAAILLCLLPAPDYVRCEEHCDMIEINRYYDGYAKLVFEQLIFYDWSNELRCFTCVDWRLSKYTGRPLADHQRGGYCTTWIDHGLLRVVRCSHTRMTWTQYDAELWERDQLPKEKRRKLRRVK